MTATKQFIQRILLACFDSFFSFLFSGCYISVTPLQKLSVQIRFGCRVRATVALNRVGAISIIWWTLCVSLSVYLRVTFAEGFLGLDISNSPGRSFGFCLTSAVCILKWVHVVGISMDFGPLLFKFIALSVCCCVSVHHSWNKTDNKTTISFLDLFIVERDSVVRLDVVHNCSCSHTSAGGGCRCGDPKQKVCSWHPHCPHPRTRITYYLFLSSLLLLSHHSSLLTERSISATWGN